MPSLRLRRRAARPLPARRRRLVRRVAAGLVAAVLAAVFAPALHAQPTLGAYRTCLTTGPNSLANMNRPDPNTVRNYFDLDPVLNQVWECSARTGNDVLVPMALTLLGFFAVIYVVWTGLQLMFAGQLDLGSLIGSIFLIGFAFAVLNGYHDGTGAPWGNQGFVFMVSGQAVDLAREIIGSADENFVQAFDDAGKRLHGSQRQVMLEMLTDEDPSVVSTVGGATDIFALMMRRLSINLFELFTTLIFTVAGWLIYAQYLWGFFALAVLSLIGPIFVPFILIKQLDFLFWGWFKALLQSALYMLAAAALYVVVASLLLAPIKRLVDMPLPTEEGNLLGVLEFFARLLFEYVPLLVISLFAAFKVGTIAGGIMAGSAPAAMGLGSALASASRYMPSGRAAIGPAAPAAAAPLSVVTAPAGVQQAYREARERVARPAASPKPGGGRAGGGR